LTRARENADGGLVLIGTANPSAAANVAFTSLTAGGRYRIVGRVIGTTTATGLYGRFREGSTDKTSSYSATLWGVVSSASFIQSSTSEFQISTLGTQASNKVSFFSLDLYVHTDRTAGYVNGQSNGADSSAGNSPRYISFGGFNVSMSNCDGFSIFASAGNLTGQIKLYEYR
jgi:hypothetical protein